MNSIKPIRTAAAYQAALTRIEHIFEAKPGTTEFDELDVLTTLIQAYDAVYHPIPEPDPIEYINRTYAKVGRVPVARSSSFAHRRTESSGSQQQGAKLALRATTSLRKS